jgi:hypothetical protein
LITISELYWLATISGLPQKHRPNQDKGERNNDQEGKEGRAKGEGTNNGRNNRYHDEK